MPLNRLLISVLVLANLLTLSLLPPSPFPLPPIKAQSTNCQVNDRNTGLISGLNVSGTFGNQAGQCVLDPKAAYAVFKVPTYDELKSTLFTQNKNTKLTLSGNQTFNNTTPYAISTSLINVTGNLVISGTAPITGTATGIFFVEGDLTISSVSLNYGGNTSGLVFIVKNNIYIDPSVRVLNGVFISDGSIYTGSTTPSASRVQAQQLVVNGSLISINSADPNKKIYFNRTLDDNVVASEVVRFQPKYLVILRGLLTQTYSSQREIDPNEIPSPLPSPIAVLPPAPPPSSDTGGNTCNPLRVNTIVDVISTVLNIAPTPTCAPITTTNVSCNPLKVSGFYQVFEGTTGQSVVDGNNPCP